MRGDQKCSASPSSVQNKLKYYLPLIVARLRTRHTRCDFWAINILCILVYEQSVCQMGIKNVNIKNFSNDTDMT